MSSTQVDDNNSAKPKSGALSSSAAGNDTAKVGGKVAFSVTLKIPPVDMARWKPEQVEQFFNGIAKMLHARNGE